MVQIETLSKVLGKLIFNALGIDIDTSSAAEELKKIQSNATDALGFDLEAWVADEKNWKAEIEGPRWDANNLQQLSDLLISLAEKMMSNSHSQAKSYLTRALALIEYQELRTKTISFQAMAQKEKVNDLLSQLP